MENISGYARVMARLRVEQEQIKPFLGKPYLKYGQCYALWGYFFQLGGLLSSKYAGKQDAFGHAFLGAYGEPGAVNRFFTEVAKKIAGRTVTGSMKFVDYVMTEFIERVGYKGDAHTFFFERGAERIPAKTVEELAWQYAEQGAALGAVFPDLILEMFEHTHAEVPKEDWERGRAVGLDIPPKQDIVSFDELREEEDALFMAYCRECCSHLHSILTA